MTTPFTPLRAVVPITNTSALSSFTMPFTA